jgi:hypothetical protein
MSLQNPLPVSDTSTSSRIQNIKASAKRFTIRTLWFSLLLIVLGVVGYFTWGNYTYSEGTRSGTLIKISKKGYVFKTLEGQLNLSGVGGFITQPGLNIFEFSVKNEETYSLLQKYEGKQVILHYKEHMRTFPWQGDTRYFVDSVTPVK